VGGSGDFLLAALHANGFANLPTSRHVDDGLVLRDAYVLSAVRCAPPDNKPTPDEIARCRRHLTAELRALPRVRVVVALGKIGHDAYLAHLAQTLGVRPRPRPAFGHGSEARLGDGLPLLLGCYHPSRQNTNTGKLTPPMMRAVFARARKLIDEDENGGQ
jgi:uracil-DNA glycosylase